MIHAGFTATQVEGICDILGAIFHLMFAEATNGMASKSNFIRVSNAEVAAKLLGLTLEELSQAVFKGNSAQTASVSMRYYRNAY